MGIKNSVEMRLCCVWRICSFFLIISHTAIQKILQNALLIKIRLTARMEKARESKVAAKNIREELEKEQEKSARQELDLKKLIAENASLREELSARRQEQQQTYVPKPLDLSEYKTRKLYIDSMLTDAGWTEGKDWLNEVELSGMPNKSETGYADYVLYDDMHRPLAVIEAKRTCVDVSKGRQQAKLYADLLEKKYKRRPVTFLPWI